VSDAPNVLARAFYLVVGGVLLLAGIASARAARPGLLLVLGGLLVLGHGFPAARRFVDPVRRRALAAADESVSSPLRIAFSVLTGLVLIAAGIVWGTVPGLPLGGWATGLEPGVLRRGAARAARVQRPAAIRPRGAAARRPGGTAASRSCTRRVVAAARSQLNPAARASPASRMRARRPCRRAPRRRRR
jgi:hypothetical protein